MSENKNLLTDETKSKPNEFLKFPSFFVKVIGYFVLLFWVVITIRNEIHSTVPKVTTYMSDSMFAILVLLLFMILHYEIESRKQEHLK